MNHNHGSISLKNSSELSINSKYPVSVTANSTVNIRRNNINLQNNIITTEATGANASVAAARATAKAASIATSSITNDNTYFSTDDPLEKSVTFQISTLCTIQRNKAGDPERTSFQPKIINSISPIRSLEYRTGKDNMDSVNHKTLPKTDKPMKTEIYTDTVKSLNYKMYTNKEIENVNVPVKSYSNKGTKFEKLRRELESLEKAREVPFNSDTNDFKSGRYSDNSVYSNQSTLSSSQSYQPRHHSVLSEPLSYLSDCSNATSNDIKSVKSSFQRNSFLNTDNESSENSYNMKKYRISDLKRHSKTANSCHLDITPSDNVKNITDLSHMDKDVLSMQYMNPGSRGAYLKSSTLNGNLETLLSNSSLFPETDIDSGTVSENYFFPQTHFCGDQPVLSFEKTRSLVDLRKDGYENFKPDISKAVSTENIKKPTPDEECNLIKRLKSRAQSTQELRVADSLTKLNVPEWMNDFKLSNTHKKEVTPRTPLSGHVPMSFKNLKHHDSILSKYKYASLPVNKSVQINRTPQPNKVLLPSSLYRSKSQNLVYFNPKEESKIKNIKEEVNKPTLHSSSLNISSKGDTKSNCESNKFDKAGNFTELRLNMSQKESFLNSNKNFGKEVHISNLEEKEKSVPMESVKSKVNFYRPEPTQKFTNSISQNQDSVNKVEVKVNSLQQRPSEKDDIQFRPTYRTEQIIKFPDTLSKKAMDSNNLERVEKEIVQENVDKEHSRLRYFERNITKNANTLPQNETYPKHSEVKDQFVSPDNKVNRDYTDRELSKGPIDLLPSSLNKERYSNKSDRVVTELKSKLVNVEEAVKSPTTGLSGEIRLKNPNEKEKVVQQYPVVQTDLDMVISQSNPTDKKHPSNIPQKEVDSSSIEDREKVLQQDKIESNYILDLLIAFTQNQVLFDERLCESFGINPTTLKLLLNVKRKTPILNREDTFLGSKPNENTRIENMILKNENNNNYVTCNLRGCNKEILQQNKIDRANCSCYNCYTYYCSKKCRNNDFSNHIMTCSFKRIHNMLLKVKNNLSANQLENLSTYAQENYYKYGEGVIIIAFESSRAADDFTSGQLNRLICQPYYISKKDVKKNLPSFKIDYYDPQKEYVVSLIICASIPSNCAQYTAPSFKLSFKLKLSNKTLSEKNEKPGNSFIQKRKDVSKDHEIRKKFFDYVIYFFKSRNVNLSQSHLLLYNKLEKYLNEAVQFEPVKIFIKDPLKNSTVACVISPNKEVVTTTIRNALSKTNSNISNDVNTTNKTITETEI